MAEQAAEVPLETSGSFISMGGRGRCRCHLLSICPWARRRRERLPRSAAGSDPKITCHMTRLAAIASISALAALLVILGYVLISHSERTPTPTETHPVLVTGATGRTGALVYGLLQARGTPVRAFVRNATKAREVLGCSACDESEGIFVGDVLDTDALRPATRGASVLVIATASSGGNNVKDVEWTGAVNQLDVYAQEGFQKNQGLVMLISTMGTTMTNPIGFSAEVGHYKLNFEAELMASQLPFVIIKPCGLTNAPARQKELLVGHRDTLFSVRPPMISRSDVARVLVSALVVGGGLRFDLCSQAGTPTEDGDLRQLLSDARYHWES